MKQRKIAVSRLTITDLLSFKCSLISLTSSKHCGSVITIFEDVTTGLAPVIGSTFALLDIFSSSSFLFVNLFAK